MPLFLLGNTFLQMQSSQPAPPCLFHIMAHDITLLIGVVHSYSTYFHSIPFYQFLQSCYTWRAIQFVACPGMECHQKIIWGDQVAFQDLGYSTRVFQGCASMVILCTCSDSQLHSQMGFFWDHWCIAPSGNNIDRVEDFGQLVTEYLRKRRLMWDVIRLQKICGRTIREYFEIETCEFSFVVTHHPTLWSKDVLIFS